ncbi:hypothetical protein G6F22_019061 [Rhizopus arrhizus]|nr:hypothetical protein G6F22_019061 [Rhizopus arrhizus]
MLLREPAGKSYVSGPRLSALARETLLNSPLRGERHRILDSLVDEIGETCNCTMLDGDEVIYLDRVETAWPLRVNLQTGSRVPLHCSASGKLFLAHMRREPRARLLAAAPLPRYTPNTLRRQLRPRRIPAGHRLHGRAHPAWAARHRRRSPARAGRPPVHRRRASLASPHAGSG